MCKITVQVIIPLCGSENQRWLTRQILAFGTDCQSLSLLSLRDLPNLIHSSKVWFYLSGWGFCSLLWPGWSVYIPSSKLLEQLPVPSASWLCYKGGFIFFFSFVQTRGQRTWQLGLITGVSQMKSEETLSPLWPLQLPPKKLTNIHLQDDYK